MAEFGLVSKFQPKGDQPKTIAKLVGNVKKGVPYQVLLGVTGSGKTFDMAHVIEKTQLPALVISHNKTLGAQLYQEFKEFFPQNAVHYFVSYYDYYQPEAYIPQSNTYIEKDAKINETIDRMRHGATQDVLSRKDCIVCASVSCIYNIGSPDNYQKVSLEIRAGQKMQRKEFLGYLVGLQYQRNDFEFKPGTFRVRGNAIDIFLVTGQEIIRVEFDNKLLAKIYRARTIQDPDFRPWQEKLTIFPASFWAAPDETLKIALSNIRLELDDQLRKLKKERKLGEAERLKERTHYDLEMITETGSCHGIENYSRHLEFRKAGDPPYTLLDYFAKAHDKFLVFIDESHITLSQIRAMAVQDKMRKETLVKYGFRLPSAIDNRPLKFGEFENRLRQAVYVSATPGKYEKEKAGKENIAEQLVRPTGLTEPSVEIRPTENQIKDILEEIQKRVAKKQRVLVLTLTKRLAEAVSDHLTEKGIKAQWLHAEIKTLERPEILNNLRRGKYDVLVGVNLLREGLDLPEVALVVILDADKEGFLRNDITLIQMMGRAARHPEGHIILYADRVTGSMKQAIREVHRRRKIQEEYNQRNGIVPEAVTKEIRDWSLAAKNEVEMEFGTIQDKKVLEKEMKEAASRLDFEHAARIRDLIKKLQTEKEY